MDIDKKRKVARKADYIIRTITRVHGRGGVSESKIFYLSKQSSMKKNSI